VLPSVGKLLAPGADVVTLVKPQFEAGRGSVGRGVIRSPDVWHRVLDDLNAWFSENDWSMQNLVVSPVHGASGNVEFLAHLRQGRDLHNSSGLIESALIAAQDLT
jgi:23S rRNA (cytidine1920-2'-O)/16S rRNA (cytidine1409-2'-O)-methyltransferase